MMKEIIAEAVALGATLQTGGNAITPGYFFEPTVLKNVPQHARAMREEIFGPVVPVAPFRTVDEAVELANGTEYGLAAYVFTRSGRKAHEITQRLECGIVSVNHVAGSAAEMPFGGRKESGYGSEGGQEGLFSYLVPKAVTFNSKIFC